MANKTSEEVERRRYPRLAIRKAAVLEVGGASHSCEIRDFCQAGLYLAFPEEAAGHAHLLLEKGATLRVRFSAGAVSEPATLAVDGRAMRITSRDVGVYVEAMPTDVLRALQAACPEASAAASEAGAVKFSSEEKLNFRQECTSRFSAFLDTVLQDFFPHATSKLLDAGYEVTFLEQSRYVFGARELEKRRAQIHDAFFVSIRRGLQRCTQPFSGKQGGMAGELSLVDENEFDDWLHLTSVSSRLETEFHDALTDIEKRFGLLVDKFIDRKVNPFGPSAICRALQDAILVLDFTIPMREVIYKAWGTVLGEHLAELYDQLREVLRPLQPPATSRKAIHRDVVPLEGPALPEAATPAVPGGEGGKPGSSEIVETMTKLYRQMQGGAAAAGEGGEYNLDRILAALNQVPGGKGMAGGAAGVRGQGRPGRRQLSAVTPSSGLTRLAGSLRLAGRQPSAGASGQYDFGAAESAQPQASLEELLAVIDSLPIEQLAGTSLGPGPALVGQVADRIAMVGSGNRRIAPAYRQTLEMAANLFGRARSEHAPASEVESLLKRLERPLLKLALKDGSFLDSPEHPAREVVNLLDQFAIAADDQGKFFDAKLQRFLSLLVDRICAQGVEDVSTFEAVRDRLAQVLQPIRQARRNRVFRLQEASEARERIRVARERVGTVLEDRLAGRDVPAILVRLLDTGWRQYLVLIQMRQDPEAEEWAQALAVLDQLDAHLSPGHSLWPGYEEEAWALLRELEGRLALVNIEAGQRDALMEDLAAALLPGADRDACLANTVSVPAQAAVPVPVPEPGGGHDATAAHLHVGEWWDFQLEGHWVPMQFIWVNRSRSRCAFANRSATNRLDLDVPEFAHQVEAGLIRPDREQDLPLMERSEYALFDESYRRLIHQAHHDPVTGLLNRSGFMQQLARAASASRLDQVHCLGLLEFDQCRVIYNACGAEAGDSLLRDLAAEVQVKLRPHDHLAAFTSDSFALFLGDRDLVGGQKFADDLLHRLKDYRFRHGEETYSIGLHIGLAEYSPALIGAEEAVKHADSACMAARAKGRNRIQAYELTDVHLQTQESLLEWAGRIDRILERDGLYLRCQMVMPIGSDVSLLPYYEILLGIRGQGGGDVQPMLFIPAVERWKRSHEIDIWVVQRTFSWIRANRDQFDQSGGFSINLSALSLDNPELLATMHAELGRADLPTEKIAFEITETGAIDSYASVQDFIRQIRRYGCKFVLDDFGSGYASYSHLKNLHLDALKIDGSFVKEIGHSLTDYAMVKSMNDIGHSLGMKTVAEYVESHVILGKLREIGVDYAQGYAIHKPTPLQDLQG